MNENIKTDIILHVICVAYERVIPLRILIDCFLVQTDPRWKLNIIYDGQPPKEITSMVKSYNDSRINFSHSLIRNQNYGHPNRKTAINNIKGSEDDYILMTNDDNYYVPSFVHQMLSFGSPKTGVVMCNTIHSYFGHNLHISDLHRGKIDMGAFIVKLSIAKAVGFNHIFFEADGQYAEECGEYCKRNLFNVIHIQRPLFIHN